MNVFEKINEVKKEIKCFTKDAKTNAYGYTTGSQVLNAIKSKMEELGLLFMPVNTEHRAWTTYNYKNSRGDEKTDFVVDGSITYAWINAEKPDDRQEVTFQYYGAQNDISKAFGSALTYSERYLLLKSLGAPTDDDDPDKVTEDKKYYDKKTQPKPQKSNYQKISELIENTDVTTTQITDYIERLFGERKKVNDLTETEFNKLYTEVSKYVNGE